MDHQSARRRGDPDDAPSLRTEIGPVVGEFAGLVNPDNFGVVLTGTDKADCSLAAREAMLGLALGRDTSGGKP